MRLKEESFALIVFVFIPLRCLRLNLYRAYGLFARRAASTIVLVAVVCALSIAATPAAAQIKPFTAYSVSFIGLAQLEAGATSTRIPVNFGPAQEDPAVLRAKHDLEVELRNPRHSDDSLVPLRLRLKQAVLNAQEALLPGWARWRSYRHAKSGREDSSGSYRDMKTSNEDNSEESLTWLNEFFHPSSFIKRNSGGVDVTRPAVIQNNSSSLPRKDWQSIHADRPVAYFDYDPATGAPYTQASLDFEGMASIHGTHKRFVPISSTFDNRTERLFYRAGGGGCRYSVPFFAEPILPFEEGVQFFVSSNGHLLTTSYTPCSDYYCQKFRESVWPGVYMIHDDLDPRAADRSIPPVVVGRDPDLFLPENLNNPNVNTTLEGFSGVWIDRYVYADGSLDVGQGMHAGDEEGRSEDLGDTKRQVSVVLTYENVPVSGQVSESNFTAQLELFTNGTIIMRYRGVPPSIEYSGTRPTHINPSLVFTSAQQQSAGLASLPENHPFRRLDRFNSTDLSVAGLVAVRFDLDIFGGHRQGSGRDVGTQRCLMPSLTPPAVDILEARYTVGNAVDMFTIPPGERRRGAVDCEGSTSCEACGLVGGSASGQCIWCGGVRAIANLKPKDTLVQPRETGICLPASYAGDYCPPSAQYEKGICNESINVRKNAPRSAYFYYNVTTLAYSGVAVEDVKTIRELLDFYSSRAPSSQVPESRKLALMLQEQTTWGMVANALRPNAAGGSLLATKIGVVRTLRPVTSPSYRSQLAQTGENMARILRRARVSSVSETFERTLSALESKAVSYSSYCRSSTPIYFGNVSFADSYLTVHGKIPVFENQEDPASHISSFFTHVGSVDDLFVGMSFEQTKAGRFPGAELQVLPIRPVRFAWNPVYHMCRFDYSSRSIPGTTRSGVQRGVLVDNSVTHTWPEDWTRLIAVFDYVYFVSANGMLGAACTSAVAPPQLYFSRMASGVDDFNTWYLREGIPPISSVINDLKDSEARPMFGFPNGVRVQLPAVIRPGRVYAVEPTPSCRQSMCSNGGRCDLNAGVCSCALNFVGSDCSGCPPKFYRPEGATSCLPCPKCDFGECNRTTGACVCKPGYTGASCSAQCANKAQSDAVAANGMVTCNSSNCVVGQGYCVCAQCVWRQLCCGWNDTRFFLR